MAIGFECFNDFGGLQIDENFFCISFRYKGSSNGGIGWDYGSAAQYTDIVITNATYPILGLYSATCSTAIIGTVRNGNTWTFRVLAMPFGGGNWFFEYYVFDIPVNKSQSTSGSGFEVRNANGEIVWDALQPIIPVVGLGETSNLPAGRKYGFVYGSQVQALYDVIVDTAGEFQTFWELRINMCATADTGVVVSNQLLAAGNERGQTGPSPYNAGLGGGGIAGGLLVLDVTNL